MVTVRSIVLKGLIEGLVLHAIERQPAHGYGILKAIEEALGEAPSKGQVYSLLNTMEEDGLIEAVEDETDPRIKQIYHLTDNGHDRLWEYRSLPPEFKLWIGDLFDVSSALPEDPEALDLEPAEPEPEQAPDPPPAPRPRPRRREDWARANLEALPKGPAVQAPYARISMDLEPETGTWTLSVQRHRPGAYEGSEACPLTYLYMATQRLLFDPPEDDDR